MDTAAISSGESPSLEGCAGCGAPLVASQRYCLSCGKRVGALRLPGSAARDPGAAAVPVAAAAANARARGGFAGLRLPGARSSGALACLTLAFGVFVGLALGPAFPGAGFATGRFVVQVPAASEQASAGGSGGSELSAPLGSPVGNVGGGGGGPAPTPTQPGVPAPAPAVPPPSGSPGGSGPAKGNNPGGGHDGLPPSHEKPNVEGTVVHVNPLAQSYSVATKQGQLVAIHTADLPRPGAKVSLNVKQLFNGTFVERGKRTEAAKPGKRDAPVKATFSGAVTYRDPVAGVYTVSVNGASVLVHLPEGFSPDDLPQLNYDVSAAVTIEVPAAGKRDRSKRAGRRGHTGSMWGPRAGGHELNAASVLDGCTNPVIEGPKPSAILRQQSVVVEGQPVGAIHLEGIVEKACDDTGQLAISADDIRESASDINFASAAPVDLSRLEPGKPVDATFEIEDGDSYSLTGISSDAGAEGANDAQTGQGDQA